MKSWSSGSWKIRPTLLRTSLRLSLFTGSPATATSPWPAVRMPFRCMTSVVLPAPLGPSRATRSPSGDREGDPEEGLGAVGVGVGQVADVQRHETNSTAEATMGSTAAMAHWVFGALIVREGGHRAGVSPAQHGQVDPLAALVRPDEQRPRRLGQHGRLPEVARGEAARLPGDLHAAHLVEDDLQVAQHERGDLDQQLRDPEPLGARAAGRAVRWWRPAGSRPPRPAWPWRGCSRPPTGPATLRDTPSTSIRSPTPMNGMASAKTTNGSSTARRLSTYADRDAARAG